MTKEIIKKVKIHKNRKYYKLYRVCFVLFFYFILSKPNKSCCRRTNIKEKEAKYLRSSPVFFLSLSLLYTIIYLVFCFVVYMCVGECYLSFLSFPPLYSCSDPRLSGSLEELVPANPGQASCLCQASANVYTVV